MSFTDPSNNDPLLHDIFTVGALTAGLPALGYLQNKNEAWGVTDKLTKFSQKLVGSDYLNNQMNRTLVSTTSSQLLSNSEQSLQKVLLSQFMALEEASPLHVLRTLQISNFLQPFTPLSSNNETIHISANSIRNQQHYYESLIKYINEDEQRKIKRKLEIKDLTRGMFFKNNTLYGVDSKGAIDLDDVIIKNARLTMGSLKNGDIYSNNHILEKFANIIGSSVDKTGVKNSPLMVVGAKNGMDFSSKWMQSTLRFSMEVGYKTLDNPLAGIEEMFHGVGAGYTGVFQSNIWNKMKEISGKVQLGTNGNYNLGIKDSLKLSAKNIAVKGGATYLAYQGVDSVLRSLSPENGIFSEGLGTGLANVYASSRIAFAKVWSDKFQGYKEQQEQSAPGSTDLSTLLAFPLAGALAGAQIAYFNRIGMSSIKGIDQAANIYNVEKESKVLKSVLNFDTKLKPMKRNALIGGLIGGSLALPFLPGALIGSSSEELRQLYSGEKEVPEKSTKFWLFGGGAWDGSQTKFFTKNWVARLNADATDKVRYGDDDTKKSMNPFLHPFSYLKDPYKLEKRNAESMPYPVWGMDVSYGSFFGKIFERTVGQIIKPDVINPAYKDAIMQGTEYTPVASSEGGGGGLGIVASDVLHAKQNVGKSFVEASKSLFSSSSNKKLQGIDNKDASLINEGLMLAPNTPGYDPNQEGMSLSYRALMDFTGIKGWGSSLVVDGLGLEPGVNSIQLARSGEASSGARDLLEQNLGDLMGCFTPEMKVKTINGYKQIQQIQIGDLVLSKGGVYRPVKQVFKKEFKDIKILKVATSTINKEIYCTPDHVFPGLKREKYSCRRPKDLDFNLLKDRQIVDYNVGDYLLIPSISLKNKLKHIQVDVNKSIRSDVNQLTLEVFNLLLKNPNLTRKEIRGSGYLDINAKDGLSTYRKLINNKGIVINLPLNKDIGKLIGWWLAEGSLEKSGRITYSMCNDEEFFADELNTIVNKYFKISGYKSFNNANNSMSFRFNHKGFSDLLERTFNIGAINKTIPEYFKHSNIEFIKGLVYGLIHGDGWFNHKNAGFTSISNKLANDVSDLLRILGINHSLLENYNEKRKSNSLPNNREVKSKFYSRNNIHINIQSSIKLRKILEVNIDEQESKIKDNKSFIYESNQYVKIKAIDVLLYSGDMYDLEIDGSDSDKELDVNYYTIEGVLCHNSGEFQRKLLPTSSGALPDRFNPIANNAPSWLPSDKSQYFVDFKHGNMYDAVDRGEERLPGVGLESLYPELKGVDAEDYSLVFKHKILSNVAKGSEEFINTRKQAIDAYQQGKLSANEIDILGTTLDQELERDRKKDFYDTPSKFQGPIGSVHNALWETMRANAESPLEMLTPIRPAAKFLHKRTAIEDYMETQLGGPDTAIWTNPYSHFIKPALNKTRQSLDVSGTFIPEEAKEKFNIDEYFDKFKYLKARRSNSEFQSDSTVIGASMSGLNTKDKVLKFKRSLQDDQKDYFDSFSQETNIDKRNKIRAMLPEDVRRGYEQIWHNMDIAKKARSRGSNIQEAIGDSLSEQTDRLSSLYNVDLTTEDKQKARAKVAANSDNYVGQGINTSKRIQYTEDELLRRKMADREALTYVNSKTGVPNTGFVGWDPRLTMDDIKIRTLSIGGQDLKRFGYWKKDEERMNRLQGIVNTDTVFTDIDRIKEDIRSDRRMKRSIENVMFDNGFRASKIDLVDSNYSSILVREE